MNDKMQGATEKLADWVVEADYSSIPQRAIDLAKERILDMVGVCLAGAKDPDSAGVRSVEVVRELGGNPVSTVLGSGFKTNSVAAAFANGASASALDICDTIPFPENHLSSCLVPSILAVGEEVNASGKDVLAAYVLSYETAVRIGWDMSGDVYWRRGFHPCNTWGCFATTAASARLLHLSRDDLRSAWGVVTGTAGGIRSAYGTMAKPLLAAFSARNGVLAAKLAKKGVTGNRNVLERDPEARPTAHMFFSFPVVFAGPGKVDVSKLTEGLGEIWNLVIRPPTEKFHPGVSATFIDLILDMVKEHKIVPQAVDRVDFYGTPINMDTSIKFTYPQESDAARYSIWYALAVALLDGEVGIKQHRLERLSRNDVGEMMQKIHGHEIEGLHTDIYSSGDISDIYDAQITIRLKDGKEHSGKRSRAKGDWREPLQREDLLNKYRTCAREALSDEDVERSIALLEQLDELPNLRALMNILICSP